MQFTLSISQTSAVLRCGTQKMGLWLKIILIQIVLLALPTNRTKHTSKHTCAGTKHKTTTMQGTFSFSSSFAWCFVYGFAVDQVVGAARNKRALYLYAVKWRIFYAVDSFRIA